MNKCRYYLKLIRVNKTIWWFGINFKLTSLQP